MSSPANEGILLINNGKTLMMKNITAEHAGNYTCLVSNEKGTENYTIELEVGGAS